MIKDSPALKRVEDTKQSYYLFLTFTLLNFYSKSLDRTFTIKVPALLIIDGASIPRLLWRIIGHPLFSRFWIAFVIHDYLYGNTALTEQELRMSRGEVEKLFYDLLRDQGVSWLKAKAMYNAVRLAGGFFFRKSPNKFYK